MRRVVGASEGIERAEAAVDKFAGDALFVICAELCAGKRPAVVRAALDERIVMALVRASNAFLIFNIIKQIGILNTLGCRDVAVFSLFTAAVQKRAVFHTDFEAVAVCRATLFVDFVIQGAVVFRDVVVILDAAVGADRKTATEVGTLFFCFPFAVYILLQSVTFAAKRAVNESAGEIFGAA